MKRFLVTVFCMINPTNQFGIYDDSGDIKIVDENAKKLQFFSSKIEDNCLGSTACSRKNFQSFIPEIGNLHAKCGMNMLYVWESPLEAQLLSNNTFNFAFSKEPAKTK